VIHVNDTVTALAPIELLRILVDEEGLSWEGAFRIVYESCVFTKHSMHAEQDLWSCQLLQQVIPRHLDIIYKVNYYHL
jgi:starch phosphorylase